MMSIFHFLSKNLACNHNCKVYASVFQNHKYYGEYSPNFIRIIKNYTSEKRAF